MSRNKVGDVELSEATNATQQERSESRSDLTPPEKTKKPCTKSPVFISVVTVFSVLAVGGIVVGVLVATGVINTQTSGPPLILTTDGAWTTWAEWGACDVTCGGGTQRRTRTCSNPAPEGDGMDCAGRDSQVRACSDWNCPGEYRIC
ncbi:uncharacterized protein LOC144886124 [Branchiostoma floridae x Branchiostoma japonicum]